MMIYALKRMNHKKCPFCSQSEHIIKRGSQQGVQRWYCKECQKIFQANRKRSPVKEALFCLFVFNKQTFRELEQKYHIKTEVMQQWFNEVVVPQKVHTPRSVSVCIDAVYFGSFCVLAFREQKTRENLWWRFCDEEKIIYYQEGKETLERLGYTIASVTADGFPGLPHMFKDIPFQYCHFHARKTITSYITKKPKTAAGIDLLGIMKTLTRSNHERFTTEIDSWFIQYKSFLSEITIHPDGRKTPTHIRLVKALRSIKHMSEYLFTYQKYLHLKIPTTTNTLEGFWKHVRVRVDCHHGLSIPRKQQLLDLVMLSSTTEWTGGMEEKWW